MTHFGDKLKTLRMDRSLTQVKIAETIGVSLRAYWNYEAGRMYPKKIDTYGKLAKLFNVTADYLLLDEARNSDDTQDLARKMAIKDANRLVVEISGLLESEKLSKDEKKDVMLELYRLYWEARKKSKEKYIP